MQLKHYFIVSMLFPALLVSGCGRKGSQEQGSRTYTATAYLEVLPLAEGSLLAETLEKRSMTERVELEIDLARSYKLAGDMFMAPDQQVTGTEWYKAIRGGDPDEALAAVMEIHPAAREHTWIGVSVTLKNPEEAALLANAAAKAIEARSAASVEELYSQELGRLREVYDQFKDEYTNLEAAAAEAQVIQQAIEKMEFDLQDATSQLGEMQAALAEVQEVVEALTTLSGDELLAYPAVADMLGNISEYSRLTEILPVTKTLLDAQIASRGADDEHVQALQGQYEALVEAIDAMEADVVSLLLTDAQDRANNDKLDIERQTLFIEALQAKLDEALAEQALLGDAFDKLAELEEAMATIDDALDKLGLASRQDLRLRLVQEATVPTEPN